MKLTDAKEIDLQAFSFYRNKNLNCSFPNESKPRSNNSKFSNKKLTKSGK